MHSRRQWVKDRPFLFLILAQLFTVIFIARLVGVFPSSPTGRKEKPAESERGHTKENL
ncbi:MAG: hypothetical protein NTV93_02040 [Verrucomicrobia bacterium]|nr:hypothetical protein [Verrucomicrobiota bacterium]